MDETSPAYRFSVFVSVVTQWVRHFGLTDWYVSVVHNDKPDPDCEAFIEYDRDTRHATITYNSACPDPQPVERVALHEVLHLLFGDLIPEDCGDDVAREEHRVIERLLNVLL